MEAEGQQGARQDMGEAASVSWGDVEAVVDATTDHLRANAL